MGIDLATCATPVAGRFCRKPGARGTMLKLEARSSKLSLRCTSLTRAMQTPLLSLFVLVCVWVLEPVAASSSRRRLGGISLSLSDTSSSANTLGNCAVNGLCFSSLNSLQNERCKFTMDRAAFLDILEVKEKLRM